MITASKAALKYKILTAHHTLPIRTANSMRIVTVLSETLLFTGKCKTIGTGLHDGFPIHTFVIVVTVLFVRKQSPLVILAQLLSIWSGAGLGEHCEGKERH